MHSSGERALPSVSLGLMISQEPGRTKSPPRMLQGRKKGRSLPHGSPHPYPSAQLVQLRASHNTVPVRHPLPPTYSPPSPCSPSLPPCSLQLVQLRASHSPGLSSQQREALWQQQHERAADLLFGLCTGLKGFFLKVRE